MLPEIVDYRDNLKNVLSLLYDINSLLGGKIDELALSQMDSIRKKINENLTPIQEYVDRIERTYTLIMKRPGKPTEFVMGEPEDELESQNYEIISEMNDSLQVFLEYFKLHLHKVTAKVWAYEYATKPFTLEGGDIPEWSAIGAKTVKFKVKQFKQVAKEFLKYEIEYIEKLWSQYQKLFEE